MVQDAQNKYLCLPRGECCKSQILSHSPDHSLVNQFPAKERDNNRLSHCTVSRWSSRLVKMSLTVAVIFHPLYCALYIPSFSPPFIPVVLHWSVHYFTSIFLYYDTPASYSAEKHKSLTHVQASMMLKLVIARGINSGFLIFIITKYEELNKETALVQVMEA